MTVETIKPQHVPNLELDDPHRSYNLVGSGINIPRKDLDIPKIFIDYK